MSKKNATYEGTIQSSLLLTRVSLALGRQKPESNFFALLLIFFEVLLTDWHKLCHKDVRRDWANPSSPHACGELDLELLLRQQRLSVLVIACDIVLKRGVVRIEGSHERSDSCG